MKDLVMATKWEENNADLIAKVRGMDDEKRIQRHSQAMAMLEAIWYVTEQELCDRAGEDRGGRDAMASAKAGSMLGRLKTFHRDADVLACEYASAPIARSGER